METDTADDENTEGRVEVVNAAAITSKITSLYTERLMTDVTLVVNGFEFLAHRLILCASSDVFAVMLFNPMWNESRETKITLTESSGSTQVFEQFLKYLYTGEVTLAVTTVIYLLQLSDKYNVKDLITLCVDYMVNHVPLASTKSELLRWYQYTANCGHQALSQMCHNFVKWNLGDIVKTDDFSLLEPEQMHSILASDDIVVTDEYTLFAYVDHWIECQQSRFPGTTEGEAELQELVEHTLAYIRFPMMAPRQLADLLLIPLTKKYKEFLMEQMSNSMIFHSGFTETLDLLVQNHPFRSKLFTPRLYSTDHWSICLTIDPFSEFHHYQSKTMVFSTPMSFREEAFHRQLEWVLDFYPKGVCFGKYLLIAWETRQCPEHIIQTVRLAVRCKHEGKETIRVQISVLIYGLQDGVEHVRSVHTHRVVFSRLENIVNMDNILPYEELVPGVRRGQRAGNMPRKSDTSSGPPPKSCFLIGESQDSIKVRIVITPINENEQN